MQVVFLEGSRPGVVWFLGYYSKRPELDFNAAKAALRIAIDTIGQHPFSVQKLERFDAVFEKKVIRTAFSVLYTIREDTIFVIDIHDQRGFRSAEALSTYSLELRSKYGM